MFLLKWPVWCIYFILCSSSSGLEIIEHHSDAFSDCTIKDGVYNPGDTVDIQFEPSFKLCCEARGNCTLCLFIDTEVSIPTEVENESHSGDDEEEYSENTRNEKSSVTICYQQAASTVPICKKVEFTVNYPILTHQNKSKQIPWAIVDFCVLYVCVQYIFRKYDNSYFSFFSVQKFLINHVLKENHIELQIEGNNKSPPSLCVKYEENGHCRTIIHLSSIAPCMCIQAWDEDDLGPWRTQTCPFNKTGLPSELKHLMWKNISVNVRLSKIFDGSSVLLWNLTAPCRLTGEVSLCYKASICKGGNKERFRWTLLVVGVMLLVSLTGLMIYFLRDYVKSKFPFSFNLSFGKKGHVVLLSPPDVDKSVSESICQLGTQLCSQGFSVSVDQWCRRDQCTMGPLPWLYSQLQKLDTMGGRILLVLNQKALEKTEEWTLLNQDREVGDQQQTRSTYSDLFTASLFIIQAHKRLGTAADRFVLVKVDSPQRQTHSSDRRLPELLQGLPLFWLPSQSHSLAAELTVTQKDIVMIFWCQHFTAEVECNPCAYVGSAPKSEYIPKI
uniref:Interleukin-17 receptor C-like n=1 Tax=Cyprinodon variegatus TaxID=28743 RepID=A0A3Q2D9Q1_CYPVA